MNRKFLLIMMASLFSLAAHADEAEIRLAIEAKLGGAKVEAVQTTPIPGIFEVRFMGRDGAQIIYSDAKGTYFFTGHLIDAMRDHDITEERLLKLTAVDFNALPFDLAVKIQRGSGKRAMAMFSDPYCPYCRRLEQALLKLDDITIYVFMFPVIRPDAADHSRAVWCSKDRAKAWLELAAAEKPKVPTASPKCANPVEKVIELGRVLRVNGTPTLFFTNGERASGMPLEQLRAKLDDISRQPAKKN